MQSDIVLSSSRKEKKTYSVNKWGKKSEKKRIRILHALMNLMAFFFFFRLYH